MKRLLFGIAKVGRKLIIMEERLRIFLIGARKNRKSWHNKFEH